MFKGFGLLLGLLGLTNRALSLDPQDFEVRVVFPPDNPTWHVYNGQQNNVLVAVTNNADEDVTLNFVGGSFKELGRKERWLRNTTTLTYGLLVPRIHINEEEPEKTRPSSFQVPYSFHAEFPIGSIGLTIWAEYSDKDGNKFTAVAFDDEVTIVEPPSSWFDPALILLYIILTSLIGGGGYLAYLNFLAPPKSKKSKIPKKPVITEEPQLISTPQGGKYEESWIPEHHLKNAGSGTSTPKLRKRKSQGGVGATSASESEAASGTEGRGRRKK